MLIKSQLTQPTKVYYNRIHQDQKQKNNYEKYISTLKGLNLISGATINTSRGLIYQNFPKNLKNIRLKNKKIEEYLIELYNKEYKNWIQTEYILQEKSNESINFYIIWENYKLRYNILDLRKIKEDNVKKSIQLIKYIDANNITTGKLQTAHKTISNLAVLEFIIMDNYLNEV